MNLSSPQDEALSSNQSLMLISRRFTFNEVNTYFIICLFGILANCVNIFVFYYSGLKEKTFKYFLTISILDLTYLNIFALFFILKLVGVIKGTYMGYMYQHFLIEYIASCLAMFVILLDVTNSLERYCILKNKTFLKEICFTKVFAVLFLISFVIYAPELFSKNIKSTLFMPLSKREFYLHSAELSSFGKSQIFGVFIKSVWVSRIILSSVILTTINLMCALQLVSRFRRRLNLRLKLNCKFIQLE